MVFIFWNWQIFMPEKILTDVYKRQEHWDGETEYAKGYYLDKDEIEVSGDLQQIENPQFRVDYNCLLYTSRCV